MKDFKTPGLKYYPVTVGGKQFYFPCQVRRFGTGWRSRLLTHETCHTKQEMADSQKAVEALQSLIAALEKHGLPTRIHTVRTGDKSDSSLLPGCSGPYRKKSREKLCWYYVAVVPGIKQRVVSRSVLITSKDENPTDEELEKARGVVIKIRKEAVKGYETARNKGMAEEVAKIKALIKDVGELAEA